MAEDHHAEEPRRRHASAAEPATTTISLSERSWWPPPAPWRRQRHPEQLWQRGATASGSFVLASLRALHLDPRAPRFRALAHRSSPHAPHAVTGKSNLAGIDTAPLLQTCRCGADNCREHARTEHPTPHPPTAPPPLALDPPISGVRFCPVRRGLSSLPRVQLRVRTSASPVEEGRGPKRRCPLFSALPPCPRVGPFRPPRPCAAVLARSCCAALLSPLRIAPR